MGGAVEGPPSLACLAILQCTDTEHRVAQRLWWPYKYIEYMFIERVR